MGANEFIAGLLAICVINLVLSGDNAVVIALASRNLPDKQRKLAIFWGSFAAIALRVVLTIVAVMLLKIPYLQTIGGLLLVWIGIKLLVSEEDEEDMEASSNVVTAIKTIVVADLIMSLDNVLAVAAASKGNFTLLIIGLVISIPIIIVGSQLLVWLMNKFPAFVYVGAGLIAWTAGEMINTDKKIAPLIYNFSHASAEEVAHFFNSSVEELAKFYKTTTDGIIQAMPQSVLNLPESLEWVLPAIITVFVCAYGWWVKNHRKQQSVTE
ncbi:MAG: Integral membrane protein TerC family protein [Pelotomaculum sp. PtaB.Bin104]|nr:MAG: Integral membrane protein TerC family protein [Pelotomaculum sp. PtaB.Bin104]